MKKTSKSIVSFRGKNGLWKVKGFWGHLLVLIAIVVGYHLVMSFYGFCAGTSRMMASGEDGKVLVASVIALLFSALALGVYALLVRVVEGQWPLDLKWGDLFPKLGLGVLLGSIILIVTTVVLACLGCYCVDDIFFCVSENGWKMILFYIPFFLMVGVFEEMAFRGIMFRLIDAKWNMWLAFVVSALLFGFLHYSSPGASVWSSLAIAIEAGVVLAVAYKLTGSLWTAIGIHWVWNYMEGPVFGYKVSGVDFGESMIASSMSGPEWVTGGAFGPEASVVMIGAGLVTLFVFWLVRKYR